jgi:hypothetical protein
MKCALLAATWLGLAPVVALADGDLPPLQPPHGELPASFWEQHRWAILVVALMTLALFVLLILWLRRSKPVVVVSPDEIARRALEALRGQPENGVLLMKVSGIFRRYVIFACGLPSRELTTTEVCRVVAVRPQFRPDLGNAIAIFLRQCDERKFAPTPPVSELCAVAGALALLEQIEQRRRQMTSRTPPPLPPNLPPPAPKSAVVVSPT